MSNKIIHFIINNIIISPSHNCLSTLNIPTLCNGINVLLYFSIAIESPWSMQIFFFFLITFELFYLLHLRLYLQSTSDLKIFKLNTSMYNKA